MFSKVYKEKINDLTHDNLKLSLRIRELERQLYQCKLELSHECVNRKRVVEFLNTNCIKTENTDGTVTHTLTSFLPRLSNLFLTRKEIGVHED